jgi:hypothetical protein
MEFNTTEKGDNSCVSPEKRPSRWSNRLITCSLLSLLVLHLLFTRHYDLQLTVRRKGYSTRDTRCKPPLPSPLTLLSVRPGHVFKKSIHRLHDILESRVAKDDIDSLVMGVVGPKGLIWSNGYGVAKANDSDATRPPDEHSIYRVASISKLFTTLETFILRDRGVLNW